MFCHLELGNYCNDFAQIWRRVLLGKIKHFLDWVPHSGNDMGWNFKQLVAQQLERHLRLPTTKYNLLYILSTPHLIQTYF